MSGTLREWVILGESVAGIYVTLGLGFAVVLHGWGLRRLDPAAAHGGLGLRCLITPGIVALWPLLARRWWQAVRVRGGDAGPGPGPGLQRLRRWHPRIWRGLGVAGTIVVAWAWAARPVHLL